MPGTEMDILSQLKGESTKSYELFFRAYYQDLFVWAHSIVKDADVAEDIVQEFFLNFWQKKQFQVIQTNLQSYIFRAVRNLCLNYLKNDSKLVRDIDQMGEKLEARIESEPLESREEIHSAVNQLPPKCKQVFLLCCIHGYTYGEVAEDLGVSVNTVRTQMKRAYSLLREKLKAPYFLHLLFFHKRIYS